MRERITKNKERNKINDLEKEGEKKIGKNGPHTSQVYNLTSQSAFFFFFLLRQCNRERTRKNGGRSPFSSFFLRGPCPGAPSTFLYRHKSVRKSVRPIAIVEIIYYIITNMDALPTIITFFKRTATLFGIGVFVNRKKVKIKRSSLFLIRRSPGQGNEGEQ